MITHNMKTPKACVTTKNDQVVICGVRGEVVAEFGLNRTRADKVCAAMNAEIERLNAEI
jgi:hypothetical protein